ncbi:MAG: hypothetical protein BIFFINMI_04297 [Phycisphaerae bacterium]|nr:hypothetical protein [Phycisphaerae bacterium]
MTRVRIVVATLRLAERCLPPALFRGLLCAAAAPLALADLLGLNRRSPTPALLLRLPGGVRPRGGRLRRCGRFFIKRLAMRMSHFMRFIPERLGRPRWRARCRIEGLDRLEAIRATGRPIVLATLHFGGMAEIFHVLRARGLPAAFLLAWNPRRQLPFRVRLDDLADRVSGLEGLPHVFELARLRKAHDFLAGRSDAAGGRILLIAVEGAGEDDPVVPGPGCSIRLRSGFLRLARMTGAAVLPCLLTVTGPLRAVIRIGTPVPDQLVASRALHRQACERVVEQWTPWIAADPEQCSPLLVASLLPPPGQAES